jgi:Flp pilus assembly protein CpaB
MLKLKKNQIKKAIIMSVCSAVLLFELKGVFFKKTESIQTPRYLMANRDLQTGELILALDFSLISNPSVLPEMPITDQQLHFLKNAKLAQGMKANEILSFEKLSLSSDVIGYGKNTPRGYFAYAIIYDNPLVVKMGENVDLYSTKANSAAQLVIEKAQVLENSKPNNQVVLALNAQSIQIYEQARQGSKITLAIQNPKETATKKAPSRKKVIVWEN